MKDKLLVTVAPSIPSYMAKSFPNLDLSPESIANEVVRACNAGANIAHLHVWDDRGNPTTDLAAFNLTVSLIRERCDIIIEGSTGGVNSLSPSERSISLNAEIEMASLNPGSVNYESGVFINSPDDIFYWAETMHKKGIKPDIAIFEAGMIENSLMLAREGLISTPMLFTLVLGQKGAIPATIRNLNFLTESLPCDSLWFVCGHGGQDLRMSTLAMSMGGHVRAGFEDNPFYWPEDPAISNAQLIERLVRIAREIGREIASPNEARQLLQLQEFQRAH